MSCLDQLRKVSVRKIAIPCLIMIAAAVTLFLVFGCQNLIKMVSPKSFADLTVENIDGAYVEEDISLLYGSYLEEEQLRSGQRAGTGKITGVQYAITLNEEQLIGLFVHSADLDRAEELMDASEAYFNGELDPEDLPVMRVKGTMTAMDSQERSYYYGAVDLKESPELRERMLPYYLDMGRMGDTTFLMLYIIGALSLALVGYALFCIIKALTGGYQKQIRDRLKNSGSQEMAGEELDRFYGETSPISGVRLGREFVLFQTGAKSILLRPWEVAWAYQRTTSHRTNGIPTGKSFTAVLNTMDGKQYSIDMKNETMVQALLTAIGENLPGTALGYSKDLEKLYKENRGAFAAHWEEACPGCSRRV